ncbi:MAG: EamA family transporter [Parachlamydiaceae bacterium]|nr:EamA family transporter [Parachlamydiaceae bacterium]
MPLVFLLYALFSSVFIICKVALEYTEPLFLVGSRMVVAGLLIGGYQLWKNREDFFKGFNCIKKLLGLAFFNIYLTNVCEVWGLSYLSPAKTCLIYSLSPFVAAFFSYFLFNEMLSWKKWAGLLIGFFGFFPILLETNGIEELAGGMWGFSWPEIAVCIAAISNVYGWILLRQLVKEDNISTLTANGLSMFFGGIFALSHSLYAESWTPIPVTEYLPFIECSLLMLLISNFIAYNLYGYLLQKFTATFMSLAGLTTPLFAAVLAWFYFGEVVTPSFYLSLAIIFLGLLIYYQEELKEAEGITVNTQTTV